MKDDEYFRRRAEQDADRIPLILEHEGWSLTRIGAALAVIRRAPGTVMGRLNALGDWAEARHLVDPYDSTTTPEVAVIRYVEALEVALKIAQTQLNPAVHPFTCGIDSTHLPLVPRVREGNAVVLTCRGSGEWDTSGPDLRPVGCPYEQVVWPQSK